MSVDFIDFAGFAWRAAHAQLNFGVSATQRTPYVSGFNQPGFAMQQSFRRVIVATGFTLLCQSYSHATPPPASAGAGESRPATAAPSSNGLLSYDEIKKLFDDGKYTDVLREVGRALSVRAGSASDAYDRYALLTLKGETHLRQTQAAAAGAAFGEAAEEADRQHLQDKAAEARGIQLLIKRSRNGEYTPRSRRGGAVEPLNLADPAARKKALAALYADERATIEPKLNAGLKARTLPPLAEAIEAIKPLAPLEMAATGTADKTKALRAELGDRARKLLTDALTKSEKTVNQISKAANETYRNAVVVRSAYGTRTEMHTRYRGLKQRDRQDLKGVIDFVPQVAKSAQDLEKALGGDVDDANELVQKATDIKALAQKTLDADYGEQ